MRSRLTQASNELYAALDLGSNSFHLLIARFEGEKLIKVDRHKEAVKLASGLQADGNLSEQAIARAADSLERFAERVQPIHKDHLRVVGTNTLRAAKNSDALLNHAESILGAPINIISGVEEARLIFLGASMDFKPVNQRLIIDIGGGSTELVIGKEKADQLESLYMGCISYTQRYFSGGVISPKAYHQALLAARSELQVISKTFSRENWQEAVGCSGSVRSIEKVINNLSATSIHTITQDSIQDLAESVIKFDNVEDIDLPGLDLDRESIFIGGLVILHAIFIELDIKELQTSSYAIREGIIYDLAGRLHQRDSRDSAVARMQDRYYVDKSQALNVRYTALRLLKLVKDSIITEISQAKKLIGWATDLHEIGLAVAHSGHHKHSAYLLANSDMTGFSRQEQKQLSFLVLNHRRKLKLEPQSYGFNPDWCLVLVLRLACLLHRRRDDIQLPTGGIHLSFSMQEITLKVDSTWLQEHPLTLEDLHKEARYWEKLNIPFSIIENT